MTEPDRPQPAPVARRFPMRTFRATAMITESAVYGVVLVSGLVLVISDRAEASWEVFFKVVGTILVFWLAHVYAGVVVHLGERRAAASDVEGEDATSEPPGLSTDAVRHALAEALATSRGLLLAALIPSVILFLGALGVIGDSEAIWGTLWVDLILLGVLGFFGVAKWSPRLRVRVLGGLATALLGVILIVLKALVH